MFGTSGESLEMDFTRRRFQNGFASSTGCRDCNSRTARFGTAFRLFYRAAKQARLLDTDGLLLVSVRDVFLQRVIAQMYAMFLSTLPFSTPARWSELQSWVRENGTGSPDSGPRVFLYANMSEYGRVSPLAAITELNTGVSPVVVSEVAFPGLGVVFVADGWTDRISDLTEVTAWRTAGYHVRCSLALPLIQRELHTQHALAWGPPEAYEQIDRERGIVYLLFDRPESVAPLGATIHPQRSPRPGV
jgi:hypothetical protein